MKTPSRKTLFNQAWKLFREFIRERDTDSRGYVICPSCDEIVFWKDCDAGHWRHGKTLECYFDRANVHLQCRKCNYFGGVKTVQKYTIFMIRRYGTEVVNEIHKSKFHYWTVNELKSIIKTYSIIKE